MHDGVSKVLQRADDTGRRRAVTAAMIGNMPRYDPRHHRGWSEPRLELQIWRRAT